jgi:hypothetical protein
MWIRRRSLSGEPEKAGSNTKIAADSNRHALPVKREKRFRLRAERS